jgi:coniferyl-aldehyde dehydrogenase
LSVVQEKYERLRAAYQVEPFPSREQREERLERLERMVLEHREAFIAAIDADWQGRSRHETLQVELLVSVLAARDARRALGAWMKPRSVRPKWFFFPSQSYVEHLPLGVVGIIAPWNCPVVLALSPLVGALAAGNRVLLKPSELTPRTSAVLARALSQTFSSDEVAVVEGGPEVASELTRLPLDHLLFTGSSRVGRVVAAAAAENLVPVTLELGGKCPALVHQSYPLRHAAESIAQGKLFLAGQTCLAPDYALVQKGQERAFADAFGDAAKRLYPELARTPDYSAIASDLAYERLSALLADAETKGARILRFGTVPPRKFPPTVVLDVTDEMRLSKEEVFGPILPVIGYRSIDEALAYVNERPRPLAFYYFDRNGKRAAEVLRRTVAGGASVNTTLLHGVQEALPFGGVGESGMGAYHGRCGFETFSHARSVFVASRSSQVTRLAPPYGSFADRALAWLMRFG